MKNFQGYITTKNRKEFFVEIITRHKIDILNIDIEALTKLFLNYFINETYEISDFSELRNKYILHFNQSEFIDKPPVNEHEFYKYICRTYLNILPNSKEELFEFLNTISKDLKLIQEKIENYENQSKILEKSKNNERDYLLKKYKHFINKLTDAKEEIVRSVINLPRKYLFNINRFSMDIPYMFDKYKTDYFIESLTDLSNKLQDIEIHKYYYLEDLYQNNKTKFLLELKQVNSSNEIIRMILNLTQTQKFLFDKKGIIQEMCELFETNKYELFCNIAAIQIEGIIYNYCLSLGIHKKSLEKSNLVALLNILKEKGFDNFNYEYYAFLFPLVRNRVAHGKSINQDLEIQSWLLLLDILDVCSFKIVHKK